MTTVRTANFNGDDYEMPVSQLNPGDFFMFNQMGFIYLGVWSSMIDSEHRCLRTTDTKLCTIDAKSRVRVNTNVQITFKRV
jgi:hypothetical protein